MKYLFIVVFLVLNSYCNELQDLKDDFYKNVVLKNINKKYNKNEIKKVLKHYNEVTYLSNINKNTIGKKVLEVIKRDNIKHDEYFSFVNLQKQTFIVTLFKYKTNKLYIIGSDLISSGNMKRELEIKNGEDHYFETPTGEFIVKKAWRSDGKFKKYDNTTQAYGSKGRFIYYFGKMNAKRYDTFDKNTEKIKDLNTSKIIDDTLNFAIHSHNSNSKLGEKLSHGCVRLSDDLNLFLENNLVLHKNFYKDGKWKLRFSYEPKNVVNKNLSGSHIFILEHL